MNLLSKLKQIHPLWLVVSGLALACWPVFGWWLARMTDGSDDPLGFAALVAAGFFLWQRRREVSVSPYGMWLAMGLILTQGAIPLPALVRGGFLVAALALSLALPKRHAGIVALLFLSLPVVASLQYFAGYPLRLLTAEISRSLLWLMGIETERLGTLIRWRDHEVGVDAACSGVKMLWSTCFLVGCLASREGFDWKKTFTLLAVGVGLVSLLNGLRATILFFPEAKLVIWPEWTHEGIGVGLFIMVVAALLWVAGRMRVTTHPIIREQPVLPLGLLAAWGAASLVTAVLAGIHLGGTPPPSGRELVEWPTLFEGERLEPVVLSEAEQRFAAGFPGQVNVFKSTSGRTVIFRRILRVSRELHSSADCLQAVGYRVEPEPLWKDDQGRAWGNYKLSGPGEFRRLREVITDANDLSFPDPSSWFWPALMGRSNGPWTAISVMEP